MSFLSELFAFIVVGDARYGREHTPLDEMREQAKRGFEVLERQQEPKTRKKK